MADAASDGDANRYGQQSTSQRRDADVTDVADVTVHRGDGVDVAMKDVKDPDVAEPLLDDEAGDREVKVTVVRPRPEKKYGPATRRMIPIRCDQRPHESPFERAGLLSMLTFHWLQPLLCHIRRHKLKDEDVWPIPEVDSADHGAKRLSRLWREEVTSRGEKAALWRTILRLCRTSILVSCLAICVRVVCSFVGPAFVLRELLTGLENKTLTLQDGLLLAVSLAVIELLRTMSIAVSHTLNFQMGMRIPGAVATLVYDKLLRLRHLNGKTPGNFKTLFGMEAGFLFMCMPSGLNLLASPLITVLALVYLWCILGPTVLIGFTIILPIFPLQVLISKLFGVKFDNKARGVTKNRGQLISEVLTYIKHIKMYAWEAPFARAVKAIRIEERRALEKYQFLKLVLKTLFPPIPTAAAVITLIVHTQLGYSLSIAQAFLLLAVFNSVRSQLNFIPDAVQALEKAKNAADEYEKILHMEEVSEEVPRPEELNVAVQFVKANLLWDMPADQVRVLTLNDVSITVPKGFLIGVCGKLGSGKSSLLAAILGQMKLESGRVCVASDVAYVAQQPFILNATVRENILFGASYDKNRYDSVLRMCQLLEDVASFPSQDLTEIGERGINLSGGQKHRLSLARAVYADKEIYLLDDVLSAVDVPVGRQIFTDCIKDQLRQKTVLLVTHDLRYLEHCDGVVYIDAGCVENGTHTDLMKNNDGYSKLVRKFTEELKSQAKKETTEESDQDLDEADDDDVTNVASMSSEIPQAKPDGHADGKLIEREKRYEGPVQFSVYWAYVRAAGGILIMLLVLIIFILNVGCIGVSNWWLSYWLSQGSGNWSLNISSSEAVSSNPDLWFYNSVHAGLLASIILISFLRSVTVMKTTLHASSGLHESLFQSVIAGSMTFFEKTPVARITSRFTANLQDVDRKLPGLLDSSLQNIFHSLMSLIIISVVFPYFLPAILPLAIAFYFIQEIARYSLRQFKRLEEERRSLLLSHVGCTVDGLFSIQAYKRQDDFAADYRRHQDDNSMLAFLHYCSKSWITVRLNLVAMFVVLITAVLAVVLRDAISPAYAGLALTYAIQTTTILQATVRQLLETETTFTAVERIDEYIKNIEPEGQTSKDKPLPSPSWPEAGEIRLEGVSMRYRPGLPSALRGINAVIKAGEKVGIVGRTGAGKSTLCAAIFRLVELSEGRILIDGTNVADLDLHQLRSRLSMIPQDPVLFAGSVRYNVDPFGDHSDENVWNALRQCHISSKIKLLPGELEYQLVEKGKNFSVGERQLVCVARALLRNSQILIMDEATASVDAVTDGLIQQTISTAFSSCTVLIIAHRLNTVQQCDKILVLKRGQYVEFDTPEKLRADPTSAFYHMTRTMMADISVTPYPDSAQTHS